MSLKPERLTIPKETARVAKAAFPKGNPYMRAKKMAEFWELGSRIFIPIK